ncbi:MAG: arginase, partial [Silicimonas sp.]|nr:arginase [Silicimonas sp.]
MTKSCTLIGAPVQTGASQPGCLMGPASLRTAGLTHTIEALDWRVTDLGDLAIEPQDPIPHTNPAIHHLAEAKAWIETLSEAAYQAADTSDLPIFMGGDHSLSQGSVAGIARYAAKVDRPLFILWLDAHSDFHDLTTTESGNIHGTPVAYFTGQTGFDGLPDVNHPVAPENICMMGLRSVDPAEHDRVLATGIDVHDMRAIDETGIMGPLQAHLARVRDANGLLHVSFDVDFLDPDIAPAVGTTVPGGATLREAHLIMETLCDSGLVTSLDLVELNPFLDERGRTASLLVDLTASLLGRRVFDRMTRSFFA